jgi:hypothetical protein
VPWTDVSILLRCCAHAYTVLAAAGCTLSLLGSLGKQTLYVPNYDFVLRFGGPLTGTLTSFCDLFGNVLTTVIYSIYPRLLERGGWCGYTHTCTCTRTRAHAHPTHCHV